MRFALVIALSFLPSLSFAFSIVQSKYPLTSLYATALVGEQFNEARSQGLSVDRYVQAGFWPRVLASHQRAISGKYYAYKRQHPRSTHGATIAELGLGGVKERPKQEFFVQQDSTYQNGRNYRPESNSKRCAPVLNTSCTINFKAARDRYEIELRRFQQLQQNASSAAATAQAKIGLDLAQAQLNQATRAYQTCLQTQGDRAGSDQTQRECVQIGVDNGFSGFPGQPKFDEDAYKEHVIIVKRSRAVKLLIDEFNASGLTDLEFLQILRLTTDSLVYCETYIESLPKQKQDQIDRARARAVRYQPFTATPYPFESSPLCQIAVSTGAIDITKNKSDQIDALDFMISLL